MRKLDVLELSTGLSFFKKVSGFCFLQTIKTVVDKEDTLVSLHCAKRLMGHRIACRKHAINKPPLGVHHATAKLYDYYTYQLY